MLRQLLTLLAVITGLTLTAQPSLAAQASVVSVAAAAERGDCIVQGTRPLQLASGAASAPQMRRPCDHVVIIPPAPTVMLQADRARE